jgi:hypothetical protein
VCDPRHSANVTGSLHAKIMIGVQARRVARCMWYIITHELVSAVFVSLWALLMLAGVMAGRDIHAVPVVLFVVLWSALRLWLTTSIQARARSLAPLLPGEAETLSLCTFLVSTSILQLTLSPYVITGYRLASGWGWDSASFSLWRLIQLVVACASVYSALSVASVCAGYIFSNAEELEVVRIPCHKPRATHCAARFLQNVLILNLVCVCVCVLRVFAPPHIDGVPEALRPVKRRRRRETQTCGQELQAPLGW